jgi:hypothetical protein
MIIASKPLFAFLLVIFILYARQVARALPRLRRRRPVATRRGTNRAGEAGA